MNQITPIRHQVAETGQKATQIRQALAFLKTEANGAGLDGLAEAIDDAMIAAEGDSIGISRLNS